MCSAACAPLFYSGGWIGTHKRVQFLWPSMMGALLSPFLRAPELAFSFGLGLMTGVLNWLSGKIEPLGLLISVHSLVYQQPGVCGCRWAP